MNQEFKKISNKTETRYILESMTAGATGGGAIATSEKPVGVGEVQQRNPNPTPRSPVARAAQKVAKGSGAHKNPAKTIPRKEKHKGREVSEADFDPNRLKMIQNKIKQSKGGTPLRRDEKGELSDLMKGFSLDRLKKSMSGQTAEGGEPDHEISMAGGELHSIYQDAKQLHAMIKQYSEMDGLDAWQQSKITKAADYLNSVLQSLQHEMMGEAHSPAQQAAIAIAKKKEAGVAEGSLNEGQYEMMMRNGQVKKFIAKDDADAKRIAAGHGAKSVIRLRGGVPAGKIAEQGVAEGSEQKKPPKTHKSGCGYNYGHDCDCGGTLTHASDCHYNYGHDCDCGLDRLKQQKQNKEQGVAEGPFTGIGKMMMKHKLRKGIQNDTDDADDALDRANAYDFNDPDRFDDEDDFANVYDAGERKKRALGRLSRKGVAEGGPFSYGKPPRKGSVAANAAQQRKEQDKKTPAIEPKDQRVGVAKVTKDVKETQLDELDRPSGKLFIIVKADNVGATHVFGDFGSVPQDVMAKVSKRGTRDKSGVKTKLKIDFLFDDFRSTIQQLRMIFKDVDFVGAETAEFIIHSSALRSDQGEDVKQLRDYIQAGDDRRMKMYQAPEDDEEDSEPTGGNLPRAKKPQTQMGGKSTEQPGMTTYRFKDPRFAQQLRGMNLGFNIKGDSITVDQKQKQKLLSMLGNKFGDVFADKEKFREQDSYLESLAATLAEKLTTDMTVDQWRDDFKAADPNQYHQFRNKTPEKKERMADAARYRAIQKR